MIYGCQKLYIFSESVNVLVYVAWHLIYCQCIACIYIYLDTFTTQPKCMHTRNADRKKKIVARRETIAHTYNTHTHTNLLYATFCRCCCCCCCVVVCVSMCICIFCAVAVEMKFMGTETSHILNQRKQ